MKTLEQELAQKVYQRIEPLQESEDRKQYGSMAHRLPVLVHTAGLVQALAFVEDREIDAHKKLLNHLAEALDFDDRQALLEKSRTAAFQEYRYLTHRVNIALTWFKRFAQSVLDVEPGSDKD